MSDAWSSLRDDVTQIRGDFLRWWSRHSGLDGLVRVGGAIAVVVTIECLAGYFLWIGMTKQIDIPPELGWTLQVGLAGGSAVGTRAFHRGHREDKWWGLAASVLAIVFLVVDAAVFALLAHGQIATYPRGIDARPTIQPGTLAVIVLAECLLIGYLTIHTLMAAPQRAAARTAVQDELERAEDVAAPGEQDEPLGEDVDVRTEEEDPRTEELPLPPNDERDDEPDDDQDDGEDQRDEDEDEQESEPRRDADYRLIPWHELTKAQAQAEARRLTNRGHPVVQRNKPLDVLRADVRDARRALGEEPAA